MKGIDKRTHKDGTVSYRARVRIKGHLVLIQSFATKTLAMKWKRDTESAVEQGKYTYDKPGSKNTLAELIDRYIERVLPSKPKNARNSQNNNLDLLYEIYQKKSKFTHPTYLVIREITTFELLNNIPNIKEIEYGQSKHERKLLELTEFFRSSIWTSIQVFIQCFHDLPLGKEDLNHLFSIHSKIAKEEEDEFIKRSNNQSSS